jgi:hypothetical protein
MSEKPIRLSRHAQGQMQLRGATLREVEDAIRTGSRHSAKLGRVQARKAYPFGEASPVNQKTYRWKVVRVVFSENDNEIVVITVLVFYAEEEE